MTSATNHIPEETLTTLVQQHLVGGHYEPGDGADSHPTCSDPTMDETGANQLSDQTLGPLSEIPVPFHLAGTAITHDIYAAANHLLQRHHLHRSKSTNDMVMKQGRIAHPQASQPHDDEEVLFENLSKPGGFRRFHVKQQRRLGRLHQQNDVHKDDHVHSVTNSSSSPVQSAFHELFRPCSVSSSQQEWDYTDLYRQPSISSSQQYSQLSLQHSYQQAQHLPAFGKTHNFLEYLVLASMMDHFAGEDLSDTDNEDNDHHHLTRPLDEATPLLQRNQIVAKAERRKLRRQQSTHNAVHRTGITKTVFLLFKAFIGSGILFLPKAFSNGGLLFSIVTIWFMGGISLYCFLLLLKCKKFITGSYGDIGEALYGKWMRRIVLFSISISQLGFVCGGTIFIVQNITEAVRGLSHGTINLPPNPLLVGVCLLLMPFVLLRNIAKISPTALLSDILIITGLLVLLGYDLLQIFVYNGRTNGSNVPSPGPDTIWTFNPKHYSVFIGTAVYSFEGIGLIIPIRDAMEKPEKFPVVLSCVMCMIALTLCLIATLGYVAFGSTIETVALLNLPPSTLSNSVQFGYAIAVQLSNVLALFPTIRIVEQALFGQRTGKYDIRIKWEKNLVRFMIVIVVGLVAHGGANDLDKFISLIGSICCCPLSLIFPPMFHIKLPSTNGIHFWIDIALIIFGVVTMLFTLYSTSMQWGTSV
ncbi:hypothetical protein DM01DRAFT_1139827 [Hesseltinella vesiculosa]|uniref:Amino acid transporter transmembrane domain-containing protein n=1 Tax=Hesseltinella vesiculosa TaxID=101127 RepID=A0A1X2G821_9FUNG|nr:hypothetical protein DM01DRAFT_1139827 [Hesseltinella vesiculosa]